jgi:hypothetical protein
MASVASLARFGDLELSNLLGDALEVMTQLELNRFIGAHSKYYSGGVWVEQKDGNRVLDKNFALRRTLSHVPTCIKYLEAGGVSHANAVKFLVNLANHDPYDISPQDKSIMLLGRTAKTALERKVDLGPHVGSLAHLLKVSNKAGISESAIYVVDRLLQLDLDPEQACTVARKIPEEDGSIGGYTVGPFNDAIRAFKYAAVDPKTFVKAFEIIGGDRPYFRQSLYRQLATILAIGIPGTRIKPNDLLERIVNQPKLLENGKSLIDKKREEVQFDIGDYFISVKGKLEHAALPYVNQRKFADGLRDLVGLSTNSSHDWEDVGEGMWAHDPDKDLWYSLGGTLEVGPTFVRHHFVPVDVSQLGRQPSIIHIHPQGLGCMVTPSRHDLSVSELHDKVCAYMLSTPSRADYKVIAELMKDSSSRVPLRAMIAHSEGVTEFGFPQDLPAIERMGECARDIRDQVMDNFDLRSYYSRYGNSESNAQFILRVYEDHNKRMPKGFSLTF